MNPCGWRKTKFLLKSSRVRICRFTRDRSFTSLRKPHCCKIRSPERIRAYRLHLNRVTVHKSAFEEQE